MDRLGSPGEHPDEIFQYLDTSEEFYYARTLGRYTITNKVGQGRYGLVKLGISEDTSQKVAIKLIDKRSIQDQVERDAICTEVKVMNFLHHRNIVDIYQVIENQNWICLIMELAAGGELFEHVSRHTKLQEVEARKLFVQILDALEYCHQNNVIHRDIKCENIFLDDSLEVVKIGDWGFAAFVGEGGKIEQACGTLDYAAPEILSGQPFGSSIDIWSVGVVLYFMVCGFLPFRASNDFEIFTRIKKGSYRALPPRISPDLKDLITKIFNSDANSRPTVTELKNHAWCLMAKADPTHLQRPKLPRLVQHQIKLHTERHVVDWEPILSKLENQIEQRRANAETEGQKSVLDVKNNKYDINSPSSSTTQTESQPQTEEPEKKKRRRRKKDRSTESGGETKPRRTRANRRRIKEEEDEYDLGADVDIPTFEEAFGSVAPPTVSSTTSIPIIQTPSSDGQSESPTNQIVRSLIRNPEKPSVHKVRRHSQSRHSPRNSPKNSPRKGNSPRDIFAKRSPRREKTSLDSSQPKLSPKRPSVDDGRSSSSGTKRPSVDDGRSSSSGTGNIIAPPPGSLSLIISPPEQKQLSPKASPKEGTPVISPTHTPPPSIIQSITTITTTPPPTIIQPSPPTTQPKPILTVNKPHTPPQALQNSPPLQIVTISPPTAPALKPPPGSGLTESSDARLETRGVRATSKSKASRFGVKIPLLPLDSKIEGPAQLDRPEKLVSKVASPSPLSARFGQRKPIHSHSEFSVLHIAPDQLAVIKANKELQILSVTAEGNQLTVVVSVRAEESLHPVLSARQRLNSLTPR